MLNVEETAAADFLLSPGFDDIECDGVGRARLTGEADMLGVCGKLLGSPKEGGRDDNGRSGL